MRNINILGFSISSQGLDADVQQAWNMVASRTGSHHVACANPHSLVVAIRDEDFRKALNNADILLPDGTGIVVAARLLKYRIKERVAGTEFFLKLSETAQKETEIKYFFLGSSDHVLKRIAEKLKKDYPSIEICGSYSPPFTDEFSDQENRHMTDMINNAKPHVLWVGMTAPKQEKWIEKNREFLDVPLMASIGAVFDFYAGTRKRAPKWIRDLGLEWLPRLLREPGRLWRRNLLSTPLFLAHVLAQKFGLLQMARRDNSSE